MKSFVRRGLQQLRRLGIYFPRRWQHVALTVGCSLILSAIISSYWQYEQGVTSITAMHEQHLQIDNVDKLLINLLQAESAVRGYIATRNKQYLDGYLSALPRIDSLRSQLRAQLKVGPATSAEIRVLDEDIEKKMAVMKSAVDTGRLAPEADSANAGPGYHLMTNIVSVLSSWKSIDDFVSEQSVSQTQINLNRNRWITFSLGLGSMLIIVALAGIIQMQLKLRERNSLELKDENQRLEVEISRRTHQITRMAQYLSRVREDEKAQLARDLHDEMGALLTAAKMDSSWVLSRVGEEPAEKLRERMERTVEQLNSAISIKRRIIDDLRPPLLQDLGLVASLETMVDGAKASLESSVKFESDVKDRRLTAAQELALFRIAQESLTNIRKYANAKNVWISLREAHDWIHLRIEDNGTGFDTAILEKSATHGLHSMKFRAESLGGKFTVNSIQTLGTIIEVQMPLTA